MTAFDLTFDIHDLLLDGKYFGDDDTCYFPIEANREIRTYDYQIGTQFLKKFYTVVSSQPDFFHVGFAEKNKAYSEMLKKNEALV